MDTKGTAAGGPIEARISWADVCFERYARLLLEDRIISDLLQRTKQAIENSHAEMLETGIIHICRECETDEGGSCCGAGLENRYTGLLLLINRLMGVCLPKKRKDAESCYFLGDRGCLLYCREVICINYVCKKITDRIDPSKLSALREKEGEEIALVFRLSEQVKKTIQTHQGEKQEH